MATKTANESMVVTTATGVREVPARKILESEAGREGLKKTEELFNRLRRTHPDQDHLRQKDVTE